MILNRSSRFLWISNSMFIALTTINEFNQRPIATNFAEKSAMVRQLTPTRTDSSTTSAAWCCEPVPGTTLHYFLRPYFIWKALRAIGLSSGTFPIDVARCSCAVAAAKRRTLDLAIIVAFPAHCSRISAIVIQWFEITALFPSKGFSLLCQWRDLGYLQTVGLWKTDHVIVFVFCAVLSPQDYLYICLISYLCHPHN